MYITKNINILKKTHHTEYEDLETDDLSLYAMKNDIGTSHRKSGVLLHDLFYKISLNKWTQVIWLYSMTRQRGRCSLTYSKSSREAPGQFVSSSSRKCLSWMRLERPLDVSNGQPIIIVLISVIFTLRQNVPAKESTCKFRIPHKCWRPKSLNCEHHRRYKEDKDSMVEI